MLLQELQTRFGNRVKENEPLAKHTTLRVGGPADMWFSAKSVDEIVMVVSLAQKHETPISVIGAGGNLLVRKSGIRGLVISNHARSIQTCQPSAVLVESGVMLPRLAKMCIQWGLSGFEWAIGIPGTIGGAIINNAGAYSMSIADNLIRTELLNHDGERAWHDVDWFEYAYRSSKIKHMLNHKPIVLQSKLRFIPDSIESVQERTQTYIQRRKKKQPPGLTIGSMFKNPLDDYAGRLIDACGLKGYRVGQAQISSVHANFFVNLGRATSDDMLKLIETTQEQVLAKFGVTLELEIQII